MLLIALQILRTAEQWLLLQAVQLMFLQDVHLLLVYHLRQLQEQILLRHLRDKFLLLHEVVNRVCLMIVQAVLAARARVQLPLSIPVRLVSLFRVILLEVQVLHRLFVAVQALPAVALLHPFVVAAQVVAQAVPVQVPAVQEEHHLQVVDKILDYK